MQLKNKLNNPIFNIVKSVSDELDVNCYVVGGWVRDLLLNRKRNKTDIDFVCLGSGVIFAEKVFKKLNGGSFKVFKRFGTAMINYQNEDYEFVGARKESYRTKSRKPIVEDGTLEDDQNRRDFTINCLAIQLDKKNFGNLIDPFNGLIDLKNKIIKTPLEPDKTFSDDPLRMLRAIRFANELNFTIANESLDSISKNYKRLNIISKERITYELNKIISTNKPSTGFKLLFKTNLLNQFFPQMVELCGVETINNYSHKDNFYHTLEVLDNISKNTDNIWLRWAAILHDIGKPKTKRFDEKIGWTFHGHEFIGSKMVPKIFKMLKLPLNEKMRYVQKLVRLHLRPIVLAQDIVTDSAIRRLLFDAGEDIEDLMILCDADITSKNLKKRKLYLNNFKLVRKKLIDLEERDNIRNMKIAMSGEDIMKVFNLKPGKIIGILKSSIKDAILDGKIKNTKEETLNYLLKEGEKYKHLM